MTARRGELVFSRWTVGMVAAIVVMDTVLRMVGAPFWLFFITAAGIGFVTRELEVRIERGGA